MTGNSSPASPRARGPLAVLHSYLFWTYERGSFHYDVMVTLILLFLFVSPRFVDFHDRPIPEVPQRSHEVLVRSDGEDGHRFVYEIRIDDLKGARSAADLQDHIATIVHAMAGDARIGEIKPVTDPHGRTVAYDAVVVR